MADLTWSNKGEEKMKNALDQLQKLAGSRVSKEGETAAQEKKHNFNVLFDSINTKINPLLHEVNQKLNGVFTLHLFSHNNISRFNPNRKFFQIVFDEDPKHPNVLHSPFLLIEGYPNTGEVRIVNSYKKDEGTVTKVEGVNEQLLSNSLSEFLTDVTASSQP